MTLSLLVLVPIAWATDRSQSDESTAADTKKNVETVAAQFDWLRQWNFSALKVIDL